MSRRRLGALGSSPIVLGLAGAGLLGPLAAQAQEPGRSHFVASYPADHTQHAISRWEQLSASGRYSFDDYAGFLLTYPGFPDEEKLRGFAEERLSREFVSPERVLTYFNRYPPTRNSGRAQYALALLAQRPHSADAAARAAWRGGQMGDTAYASLLQAFGMSLSQDDHDARMDALLWQRDTRGAERQLPYVSSAKSALFAARLAILMGADGSTLDAAAVADPGYIYDRSRELRTRGRGQEALALLASRPPLSSKPFDPTAWIDEHLEVARIATPVAAMQIAARAAEAFDSEAEVVEGPFKLRDDFTSLMWLGATRALWELGEGNAAAALFYRYGAAARTPQTRSKGFFWAGQAAQRVDNHAEAIRYYELAAGYPEYFYGMLALERLGQPLPALASLPHAELNTELMAAFHSNPLIQALPTVARGAHTWQTKRKFYTHAASLAQTEAELAMVGRLAIDLNLPELAVVVGRVAPEKGFSTFSPIGFPTVSAPSGADWTMVHAIARQESEFDSFRTSHAGAAGMMQLMPGTAREQATRLGVAYMSASLMQDQQYNIRLGDSYFQRMMNNYRSYPLAVAAYNAGPGNVNKWLRENGDPRTGTIDWTDWIERIGFFETRNYVARVIENAVVYEALHPDKTALGRPRTVSELLR